jgi:hypothetical protein
MKKHSAKVSNGIMVTWSKHCFRSSATGLALGIPVHYIYPINKKGTFFKLIRYIVSSWQTILIIRNLKPKIVVVHNLPVFIALAAFIARLINKHHIVFDFHSGALTNKLWRRFFFFYKFIFLKSPFTLAHNPFDSSYLEGLGAKTIDMFCLPRDFPGLKNIYASEKLLFTFVCSYNQDEPLDIIFDAVNQCPNFDFQITGDYKKRGLVPGDFPQNLKPLGFLSHAEYIKELGLSTAIVSLSDRPNIMHMAIHEAVSIGVPVITNHSDTTRRVLESAGIFCDLTIKSLKDAINYAAKNHVELRKEARKLKPKRLDDLGVQLKKLKGYLEEFSEFE